MFQVPRLQRFNALTLLLLLLLFLAAIPSLRAQQNQPHLGYAYPAGGRQGTSFQVKLGGEFINAVTNVYISGSGAQVAILDHTRPLTPMQINALRQQVKELQDKKAAATNTPAPKKAAPGIAPATTNVVFTADDQRLLVETRQRLAAAQKRSPNPAIAETVVLRVALAADAEPGAREIRLATALGLSNPLVFGVGQLPEFRKTEPVAAAQPANRPALRNNAEQNAVQPTDTAISLPAVVNGQILQGGQDRFHFSARKGQRLVIAVAARELIPYLADAVPGWFQATVALYDAKGNELAYDDHYRYHPDPVVSCEIPGDGQYTVEVRDSIYRGREDFVYRITIGELPFITSIFPLGGPANAQTKVELKGWNLPQDTIIVDGTTRTPGIQQLFVPVGTLSTASPTQGKLSNHVPFMLDTLPECLEQEPNNSPETAQAVTLPIIINGRIDKPGDLDVFRFEGRAGQPIVAEVDARRLDSPLDSVLKLTDATGRQLAFNDDFEDKGSGLDTHHADSYLTATLPANGTYYLHLGDTQHQGGPEYAYRLRISAPRPDFALRLVPSSISVRAGMNTPITVYALRKDGFTNAIALALKGAPPGFSLSGSQVPENQDQVKLTLKAPAMADSEPLSLSVEGRATVQGRPLVRPAVPADDMMQAFAYRHLVPAQQLAVAVIGGGRGIAPNAGRVIGPTPVKLIAGGTSRVLISSPAAFVDRWDFELSDPPDGLTLERVSAVAQGAEIVLSTDATKLKPGTKGNLIVALFPGKTAAVPQKNKKQAAVRRPTGTLPAIPYEVIAQ